MGEHRDRVSAPDRPVPPEPACARAAPRRGWEMRRLPPAGACLQRAAACNSRVGTGRCRSVLISTGHSRSRKESRLHGQPWKGTEFPFVILTIKSSVFLQIQSYKLFILICCILEGEFNTIHTFSFINLSVIRVLAHGRK